jgi:hypothetical protein
MREELMTITEKQMEAAAKYAASDMAYKMGLSEVRGVDALKPEQFIMIASSEGIQMGILKTRDMANMRYVAYKLNGQKIFEKRYLFHGKLGWDTTPTTQIFFDKEATIYAKV